MRNFWNSCPKTLENIQKAYVVEFLFNKIRAYSRPLLGAIIAPNLVPWFLEKIFLLEVIKNDICFGGASKQNAPFWKNLPQKTHACP